MKSGDRDLGLRLAIVLPAHNEAGRLGAVLTAIPARLPGVRETVVIVLDDGSGDGTAEAARRAGALVLRHRVNLGKGAALTTACEGALAIDCDAMALMDADGQHRPGDLPRLVAPLAGGGADLVLTYRTFSGSMPALMRAGNWGLSTLFRLLFGASFRDTQCGFRAFSADAYRRLRWEASDYAVETEMLIRAARGRLRLAEIPIDTVYHDRYKGTTMADGVRILVSMLRLALTG